MNGFGSAVRRSCAALLRRPRPGEYGLLVPVARVRSAAGGREARRVLEVAGIRSTVAPCRQAGADDGGGGGGWAVQVLVFGEDAAHARRVLCALPAAPVHARRPAGAGPWTGRPVSGGASARCWVAVVAGSDRPIGGQVNVDELGECDRR